MTTLTELTSEFRKISDAIIRDFESEGETNDLVVRLQEINIEVKEKVDAYKYTLDRLKDEASYWKARAAKAKAIEKAVKNGADFLKRRLKACMYELDAPEVEGNEFRFKIVKNQPALVIDNPSALPDRYQIQTIVTEIDKATLKADLKSGEIIEGAHLEHGESVRPYVLR